MGLSECLAQDDSFMTNYQFKTIGFIEKHDESMVLSEYMDNHMVFDASIINEVERKKIINYLTQGTVVHSTPLALFDENTYIAPHMLLSDGEWIWTSHFSYYLNKFDFSRMTSEFLNHLRNKKYKSSPLSKELKTNIDIFLGLKMLNLGEKVRESIRQNVIKHGYDLPKI